MFGSKTKKIAELEEEVAGLRRGIETQNLVITDLRLLAMGSQKNPNYRGIQQPRGEGTDEQRAIHEAVQRLCDSGILRIESGQFVRE